MCFFKSGIKVGRLSDWTMGMPKAGMAMESNRKTRTFRFWPFENWFKLWWLSKGISNKVSWLTQNWTFSFWKVLLAIAPVEVDLNSDRYQNLDMTLFPFSFTFCLCLPCYQNLDNVDMPMLPFFCTFCLCLPFSLGKAPWQQLEGKGVFVAHIIEYFFQGTFNLIWWPMSSFSPRCM